MNKKADRDELMTAAAKSIKRIPDEFRLLTLAAALIEMGGDVPAAWARQTEIMATEALILAATGEGGLSGPNRRAAMSHAIDAMITLNTDRNRTFRKAIIDSLELGRPVPLLKGWPRSGAPSIAEGAS